jgi:hypothetical protein
LQEKRLDLDKKRKELDEKRKHISSNSKAFSKDWQLSYDETRDMFKAKTKKRRK